MVKSWIGFAVDDGAAGVLVFKGFSDFVGFPTGRCNEGGFLRDEFDAFTYEGVIKSGDELDAEGAGHRRGLQPGRQPFAQASSAWYLRLCELYGMA